MVKDLRFLPELIAVVESEDVAKLSDLWSSVLRKRTPPFGNQSEYADKLCREYRHLVVVACSRRRDIHALVYLVNNGFPVNSSDGPTTPLQTSVSYGNKEAVSFLLASNAAVDSPASPSNRTRALHVAVSEADCSLTRMLLCRGGGDISLVDPRSGRTPLEMAAHYGHSQLCGLLLSYDAPVISPSGASSALHVAASQGHVALLEMFARLIDVDTPTEGGNLRALHEAAARGHHEAVALLLRWGADPSVRDTSFRCPLHHVVASEHDSAVMRSREDFSAVVESLLKVAPLLVSCADARGDTPLHLAARYRHHRVAELLMTSGSSTEVVNDAGRTPCEECPPRDTAMKHLFAKHAHINTAYLSVGQVSVTIAQSPQRKLKATAPHSERNKKRLAPVIVN